MPSFRSLTSRTTRLASLVLGLFLLAAGSRVAAGDVTREFRFSPADIAVTAGPEGAVVTMKGAVPGGAPGAPELPLVPAFIDLLPGERARAVEIEATGWTVVLGAGRLRPAAAISSGLPRVAAAADAAIYDSREWFPASRGTLGASGNLRGRPLASLALSPVRVRPATGELEVATRFVVHVRTELDPNAAAEQRRRVVPEWDRAFEENASMFGLGLDHLMPITYPGARIESAVSTVSAPGKGFAPTSVPSVEGSPVQFLILTNNAMAPQMQRLADWRTQTGVPTVVRTIEFVQANYPYGFDLQDRLRRFVKEAYLQWGITHLLLAGDTDVLPPRYGRTTFFGGNFIPTDLYFSDLDGTWNADGDSLFGEAFIDSMNQGDNVNMMPEVFVGRAPITNVAQATTFVDKTLQYCRTPLGNYEDKAVFAGEVLFPQDWSAGQSISLDGAADAEAALRKMTPQMTPRRLYENYTAYDSVGALQLTRQRLLDSLATGAGILHHVGHGFRNSMSVGDAPITNPDAEALTNGNRTWLLYSINCTSNAIDFASLGEAFVLNPNGGAVANVGSTREDFPVTGRSYQDNFYDLIFLNKVPTLGQAFAQQKVPFVGLAFYDNTHRWTQYTLSLLGDPALPIWWRRPIAMNVSYPGSVPQSDTLFTVHVDSAGTAIAGARVCLLKTGEEYEVTTTDAGGNAILHVRPETAGVAKITVTNGGGYRPFEGNVTFSVAVSPVLISRSADRTVDDDNAGGTSGDGSGLADAGETIDWLLPVKNAGATTAPVVTGSLSTADPRATVLTSSSLYGSMNAGVTLSGSPYRVLIDPATPDGTEILFRLDLFSGSAHFVDEFRLPVKSPRLVHILNTITDNGTGGTVGNNNGRLDIGETVDLVVALRNTATGVGRNLTATLSSATAGISIPTPNATIPDIAGGAGGSSTAFRIVNTSAVNPKFTLTVSNTYGVVYTRLIDAVIPASVTSVLGTGAASTITLGWTKSPTTDIMGYNIYRSLNQGGPFAKVNLVPTDRTAYFVDESLPALTRFYYQVSTVDSSGNESAKSLVTSASTNPPLHAGFPLPTERNMPSPVAIGNIDNSSDSSYEILAGANVLYAWHADGTPVLDADGTERTSGDFTTQGSYYAAGASIADLDNDGTWEIVCPTWISKTIEVFRANGTNFPGFPKAILDETWSSAAVGNIDADPQQEIVFGSNGTRFYAFNFDGTEVRDGDSNPATIGVFKVMGGGDNYASPALADLDNDGKLDIIMPGTDGFLYAWRGDGSNLTGWPVNLFAASTSSPAVGDIDNDGVLEIALTANNSKLLVYNSNGTFQTGFPVNNVQAAGVSKYPSPALANMGGGLGAGHLDVVINTTDGLIKVFRSNGTPIPQWTNIRYSYTTKASESSPVVADIDGDGLNEVVVGGEDANLYAFDNDASLMAGFPIHLNGEVRGTPLVWDVDHDGLTEILLSCWDKNVYMWEYPGAFSPTMTPPWAMWRHDQARQGRVGAPIVVAANAVAFSASDGELSGLALAFALPAVPEASGNFDVYRATGSGELSQISHVLPPDFTRLNREPLIGTPGDLLSFADASALPGTSYRYMLVRRQEQPGDGFVAYGPFAASASSEAPALAFVTQNFPNPARASGRTSIAYGVPVSTQGAAATVHTTLRFYDVRGRVVRTLVDELVPPGRYNATWDGTDDRGSRVGAGVYFYEFIAGPARLMKKALILGQ